MKHIRIAVLFLTLSMILCACQAPWEKQDDSPDYDGAIYYLNKDRDDLVARGVNFDAENGQALADEMTKMYSLNADTADISPLPDGVVIESTDMSEGSLNVHFSTLFAQTSGLDRSVCLAALVRTYIQIPEVSTVTFFIGEDPLVDEEGEAYAGLTVSDFLCLSDDLPEPESEKVLTLYYGSGDGKTLSRVQVPYTPSVDQSRLRLTLTRLIEGPAYEEETRTVPAGTKILGVYVVTDTVYVNLSEEFSDLKSDLQPALAVYAIVNSIVENSEATHVQILIDGQAPDSYGGQIDLRFPLEEDLSLVK